jgi:hypothetical protein
MGDLLLHLNARVQCAHMTGSATMMPLPPPPLVRVSGMQVATQSAQFLIAGCPFAVGTKPQPCVTIRWLRPALRVRINKVPVLLQSSTGLCQSAEQAPQGPPVAFATQVRVRGS